MKNNAMKSVGEKDSYFAWSEDDCAALGVNRNEAHLAWRLLIGDRNRSALDSAGFEKRYSLEDITTLPTYARAVAIMSLQYLNAVALPVAIRTNMKIAQDDRAPAPARVRAASVLIEHGERMIERFKDTGKKSVDDLPPEALGKLIDHLSSTTANEPVDVQSVVQTAQQADYLSDMS